MEHVSSVRDYPMEPFEPVHPDADGSPETRSAELVMQNVELDPGEPITYGPRYNPERPTTHLVEFGRVGAEYLLSCEHCEEETVHDEQRATRGDAILIRSYKWYDLTDVLPYPTRS